MIPMIGEAGRKCGAVVSLRVFVDTDPNVMMECCRAASVELSYALACSSSTKAHDSPFQCAINDVYCFLVAVVSTS
jgi:hypothetical protein